MLPWRSRTRSLSRDLAKPQSWAHPITIIVSKVVVGKQKFRQTMWILWILTWKWLSKHHQVRQQIKYHDKCWSEWVLGSFARLLYQTLFYWKFLTACVTTPFLEAAVALPIYNKNKDLRFLEKDYAFFVESLAPKKIPCMQKKWCNKFSICVIQIPYCNCSNYNPHSGTEERLCDRFNWRSFFFFLWFTMRNSKSIHVTGVIFVFTTFGIINFKNLPRKECIKFMTFADSKQGLKGGWLD